MNSNSQPLQNSRHEKFAQFVADGVNITEAYRRVYNSNDNRRNGSRLWTNALIRARVEFLKQQTAEVKALSREEKRNILAGLARDTDVSVRERILAIQEDNRMTGDSDEKKELPNFTINFVK